MYTYNIFFIFNEKKISKKEISYERKRERERERERDKFLYF